MGRLTTKKVKQDLKKDIKFYEKEIRKLNRNIEDMSDEVELEKLRREKQERERELKRINSPSIF